MKLSYLIITFSFVFCLIFDATSSEITISFGSCYKQDDREIVFENINNQSPDAFFWLGDIIYADHYSPERREAAYNQVKRKPAYQTLKTATIIDGTWDDHDYAHNNANGSYIWKEESKKALLNFLEIDKNNPVFKRKGVYHKRQISRDNLSIDTFFLDTRSFMNKGKGRLLGRMQWEWLEKNIHNSSADLIIISSSISVLSPVSRFLFWIEGWHQFAHEKERLIRLIGSARKRIILLSGDRHYSDASRVPLPDGRFLYEFMSSGMTKTSRPMSSHIRVNTPINEQNFSTLKVKITENHMVEIYHGIYSSKTNNNLQRNIITLR